MSEIEHWMPKHPSLPRSPVHLKRLFNKKHILWLIPIALLLAGCAIWNVPISIFWEIALLLWFSVAPGYFLASLIAGSEATPSQRLTFSCALGMGVTVLVSVILNSFHLREYSAIIVSIIAVVMIASRRTSKRKVALATSSGEESLPILWLTVAACILALVYNFSSIHFTTDGGFAARGLFAIDVPYLIGNMPSLDLYGKMHDMHQNGLWFPYHDYVYRFISIAHQVGGTDYFSLIAYSFPIVGGALASLSLFSVFRIILDPRRSLAATLACIAVSSAWGDHILTGALSPSYLAGIVYACAIILLIHRLDKADTSKLRLGIWILLGLSLGALAKTKLPLFLIVGCTIGLISLLQIRKHQRTGLLVLAACILSLVFGLTTSGSSLYQPAGDFVIGAPLMGYANQLAKLLHVHPATVDPIIQDFDFELEDLLIPFYTIVHLLRMIVLDARLLLFVAAIVLTKRNTSDIEKLVKWFGMISVVAGLLLPVLYSPAWYPLAISFYTPEIAGMIALVCALILLFSRSASLGAWSKRIAVACIAYGFLSTILHIINAAASTTYTLSSDEVKATQWLREQTPPEHAVATLRTDLDLSDTINDESFYLYGALAQRRMLSEGAKYGALLSAVADTDTLKGLHPVGLAQTKLESERMWLKEFQDTTPWIVKHGYPYAYYLNLDTQVPPQSNWKEVFRSGSAAVFQRVR